MFMIYLDHAAATPVSDKVLQAMMPYFSHDFFNPSAAYLPAKKVAADYEAAKAVISNHIGAKSSDLIITAGATEANNLAFSALDGEVGKFAEYPRGLAKTSSEDPFATTGANETSDAAARGARASVCPAEHEDLARAARSVSEGHAEALVPHTVLYLATEHDSVRKVAEKYGGREIKVDRNGRIDLDDLKRKITDVTELISVALVNGELGTIQPLAEIASLIREIKFDRLRRGVKTKLLLHSDASQALNLLDINVARLGVDLLTLNSAKIYGPKGVGALYVSHEAKLAPLTYGGGQENGLRSGTENVPGVIGFAKAVELAHEHLNGNRKKYAKMKQTLLSELQGYELITKGKTLDNFVNICYNGIDGERLVFLLEEKEIYVATGAACAARKGEKSHVLKALGLSDSQIAGSLRLTLGETNTEDQIKEAAKIINGVVADEHRRITR